MCRAVADAVVFRARSTDGTTANGDSTVAPNGPQPGHPAAARPFAEPLRAVSIAHEQRRVWGGSQVTAHANTPASERTYISWRQAAFIGVGSMVGAGIFSLLAPASE